MRGFGRDGSFTRLPWEMFFSYPAPVVVLKLLTFPFPGTCCFPLKWVCYQKSQVTDITYRIRSRQQAPLDESFKGSLQNKVLLRDGLLGDLLCWQCLHMLSNREQVRLFQVTVPTCCFQLNRVALLPSLAQLLFLPCGCVEVTLQHLLLLPLGSCESCRRKQLVCPYWL